jgi:hypothetical protein
MTWRRAAWALEQFSISSDSEKRATHWRPSRATASVDSGADITCIAAKSNGRTYHAENYLLAGNHSGGTPLHAREKSDVIVMKNGDKITCEVKGLASDTLYISVDYILNTGNIVTGRLRLNDTISDGVSNQLGE